MKEQLKKADILGLAIIAAALISWSVRSVWSPYQTIAVVLGLGLCAVAQADVIHQAPQQTKAGVTTVRMKIAGYLCGN